MELGLNRISFLSQFLGVDFHPENLESIFVQAYQNTGSSEGRTNRDTFYKSSCSPSSCTEVSIKKRKQIFCYFWSPSSARPGSHLAEGQCVRGETRGKGRKGDEEGEIIISKKSTAFPDAL